MFETLVAVFGMCGGAGIISGLLLRKMDRMNKKLDDQASARIEESITIIKGLKAIGHLSEATAVAQRDGRINGEMEMAMEYYHESRDNLNDFLTRRCAERTHSR